MKIVSVFLFLVSFNLFSQTKCEIEIYPKFILKKDTNDTSYIKKTNCEILVIQNLHKAISNVSGNILTSTLEEMAELNANTIAIFPAQIEIIDLEKYIVDNFSITEDTVIKNIGMAESLKAIMLNPGDKVRFTTSNNFNQLGEQTFRMIIENSLTQLEKTVWLKGFFYKKIYGYKAKVDISNRSDLSISELFSKEEYLTTTPEQYLTNMDSLKFYKLNRSIRSGEVLKNIDISPIVMIKAGNRVKVNIFNNNMTLSSSGVANKSGVFGDTIEVTNPNSRKKFIGKVTDFNTVVIDL